MDANGVLRPAAGSGPAVAVVQGVSEKLLAASALNAEILQRRGRHRNVGVGDGRRAPAGRRALHELDDVAAGPRTRQRLADAMMDGLTSSSSSDRTPIR